jgi:hypothetical protein
MQQKVKPMTPTNWTFDHEDFDLAYDMIGSGPDRGASKINQVLIALMRRLTAFFVPSRKKPGGVANTAGRSQGSSRNQF